MTSSTFTTSSNLPDPTSIMRDHVLRLRAWAEHRADPDPLMRRGAIYIYHFNEPRVESGEVWKARPVVLMNENPIWRLNRRLPFHVVPLSGQEPTASGRAIEVNGPVGESAIIAQATTINPFRLGSYNGQLNPQSLDRISNGLRRQIDQSQAATGSDELRPANVFEVQWHDRINTKTVCILGSDHLADPSWPVAATVVTPQELDHEEPMVRPRPVALTRFVDQGAHLGKVDSETFSRLQKSFLRNFGLGI